MENLSHVAEIDEDVLRRKTIVGGNMFSRKGKRKQTSPVNKDSDKHSNSAKQLNGECTGNQPSSLVKMSNGCKEPGDGHPHEHAETAMEQGAPLGKGAAKSFVLPDLNAVVVSVGHLPSQCTNRKKIDKRKHFDVLLAESMVASAAGEKKLEEEGEEGGSMVSGDEHPAAPTDRPLLQLTADALLPDGGIRSITTQFKKRGKQRKSSAFSLGGVELLPVEEPPLKFEGRISSAPRNRKGRPRRLNIGTLNDLSAGSSISGSDDQPLSMLFGFHLPNPTTVDDPRLSSPSDESQVDVVQKKNKANEGTPPPPPSSSSSSTSGSKAIIQWNGSSPFMKRSPIWKAIESMQVFHKFPQNPHFLPLLDLKEDSRDGLAIGHMVTFANVAQKAFKLKITQDLTTCLETLQDLEPHGFDVTVVRDHLKKMLSIKETQQKLRDKKTQMENRILKLTREHSEIDKEIVEFNDKMKHLQEKLASAKSKKGEKLSEIVFLKGKSGSISQLIDGAAHNMEDPAEYYLKIGAFLPPLG